MPEPKQLDIKQLYDGFRDPATVRQLARTIAHEAQQLTQPLNIMEVCGGHTHTLMKFGLKALLPENIHFIHGPGCPVCVMPRERIDHAITLAAQPDIILVTLGDMIRIPGSASSLAQSRANGSDVRPLYDPLDALAIARQNPTKTVVFFAIGFETSTPMTAVLLQQAEALEVNNLLLHINHVLVPPAVDAVMADPRVRVNAFVAPSHVSVIQGADIYQPLVDKYATPVVVAGFEPVDMMEAVLRLVRQKNAGTANVDIQYSRAVNREGNRTAQKLVADCFAVRDTFRWRGLGPIAHSALQLQPHYQHRDAEIHFRAILPQQELDDHKACQCGAILRGLAQPADCRVFARGCTPERPLGSCMVSSEGACNAYYRYQSPQRAAG